MAPSVDIRCNAQHPLTCLAALRLGGRYSNLFQAALHLPDQAFEVGALGASEGVETVDGVGGHAEMV